MKNKSFYLTLAGCMVALGIVVCWLIFGSTLPVKVPVGKDMVVSMNMKNTTLSREQDGKKLWEFLIQDAAQDGKSKHVIVKGLGGKVYRKDGSFIEIKADGGTLFPKTNDFELKGNIRAEIKDEGYFTADEVKWEQQTETITATGSVVVVKGDVKVTGDKVVTTSALKKLKVTGHAKATKGGN